MLNELFTVTDDHMKLLPRLHFDWDDQMYSGAPVVDIKRPYGNSDPIYYDVPVILGMITPGPETENAYQVLTEEQVYHCKKVHREMEYVLQILCFMGSVRPGEYQKDPYRDTSWRVRRKDNSPNSIDNA